MMTAQSTAEDQVDQVPDTSLEDENARLRKSVDDLRKVNAQQLQRLVQQELLQIRIKELEQHNRLLEQKVAGQGK
jgi:hypothetical protein